MMRNEVLDLLRDCIIKAGSFSERALAVSTYRDYCKAELILPTANIAMVELREWLEGEVDRFSALICKAPVGQGLDDEVTGMRNAHRSTVCKLDAIEGVRKD